MFGLKDLLEKVDTDQVWRKVFVLALFISLLKKGGQTCDEAIAEMSRDSIRMAEALLAQLKTEKK